MGTIDHGARAHALLAPSSAARWIACPPSALLEDEEKRKNGGDKGSKASREGTLAHEFGDIALQLYAGIISAREYREAVEMLRKEELYTTEMEPQVNKYTDFVIEQFIKASVLEDGAAGHGALLIPEKRYDLSRYIPDSWGTVDASVVGTDTLYITDLKYGRGVQVWAQDNAQLRLYALGALEAFADRGITKVVLTIVQPRLDHIDEEVLTAGELIDWGFRVAQRAAHLAIKGAGKQRAGDWCRFCAVAYKCKAQADNAAELAAYDFAEPTTLNDDQLLKIYEHLESFKLWAGKVEKYVYEQALKGKSWEGFKLIEGRSSRKWSNPTKTAERLISEAYDESEIYKEPTIRGIGDIEKLLGKKQFAEVLEGHTYKAPAAAKLVPESAQGTPYSSLATAREDFSKA